MTVIYVDIDPQLIAMGVYLANSVGLSRHLYSAVEGIFDALAALGS